MRKLGWKEGGGTELIEDRMLLDWEISYFRDGFEWDWKSNAFLPIQRAATPQGLPRMSLSRSQDRSKST